MITLYTIGFTKKNARKFFGLLKDAGIKKLVDIRINNASQLAGFAKGSDLEFFMKAICDADYVHITDLAPTKELLKDYQDKVIDWNGYTVIFNNILKNRRIAERYRVEDFDQCCFLCAEDTPEKCHRRLVAEFFRDKNPSMDVQIIHLH
jgi:uncharacterized protein (DUF488 family)